MPKLKQQPLILLLLSTLLISTWADDTQPIQFDFNTHRRITLNSSKPVYYKFHMDEVRPQSDLAIVAHSLADTNLEMYLSSTEKAPNSVENSEYYSKSGDYSSIYVPESDLTASTEYHLGLICKSATCDFDLLISFAGDYALPAEYEYGIIPYSRNGTLVIRVEVAEQMQASHIVIAAEVLNLADIDREVNLYLKKGNDIPTSTNYDMVGLTSWNDGKAVYVFKGDQNYCTGCNYTVTVEAPEKSLVILRRTVYGYQIPTKLNSERDDAVEMGKSVTYAVNISDFDPASMAITVELTPYYGTTQVFANVGTLPEKLEGYQYNMTDFSQEVMMIPIQTKPENGLLYITVNGTTYSTYTISIYALDKQNLKLTLGEPEVGYTQDQEVLNYIVEAPGQKDMKMTFTLHPEQGGQVYLFVKSCEDDAESCSFTSTEISKLQSGATATSQKSPILLFSNNTSGDQEVKFSMDGTACGSATNKGAGKCSFAVGVVAAKSGTSKFTVTANRASSLAVLRMNQPIRTHISQGEYQYFQFTVLNDTGMESVNFQVTKVTGDVDVFISRQYKYPDARDREDAHHYNDLYSFEKPKFQNLSGTYHVAVRAGTSATFSIVPFIMYNMSSEDMGKYHLTKLSEAFPQKKILDDTEPVFFSFDAPDDEHAQGLEITLDEVQGKFVICVRNDGQRPGLHNCQFSSNTSVLVIPKTAEGYQSAGRYIIGVFYNNVDSSEEGGNTTSIPKAHSFIITWAVSHMYRPGIFNVPLMSWISVNRTMYFNFDVYPQEDSEIVIHESKALSSTGQVVLYLTNHETKLGHNVSAFNADRIYNDTDTITLNKTEIESLCDASEYKCTLYFALATTSSEEIELMLTLTKDFNNLKLVEGLETTYPFPNTNHVVHLYYYPPHLDSVTFLAHTSGRNISLYANVINTRDYSSINKWKFPTNKSHSHKAVESAAIDGESRLYIPAADLTVCLDGDESSFRCGVALSLYYGEADLDLDLSALGILYADFSMFRIIATQEITPIAAGKPIHTSVEKDSYRYFSLYVDRDDATLMISANVLSGDRVTIIATKGKDARPTLINAEFRSWFAKTETMEIAGADTKQGTAKGYWTIGIHGSSNTEFVLNVIYEKDKMTVLQRGLPVTAELDKDARYFEYYHESNSTFQVKITKEHGSGLVVIKTYTDRDLIAGNLPTKVHGQYFNNFGNDDQVFLNVYNTSLFFCSQCVYVIAIFPSSKVSLSIVTMFPGSFIKLTDNMIFIDRVEENIPNKYEHSARVWDSVDINLIIYSGHPKIYISHNPSVNESHHIWNYTEKPHNNIIRLKLDNSPYVMAPPEREWDGSKITYSYPYNYYIMVVAPNSSNYSIAVSVSNSTRTLVGGHLDFGFLNPGEFNLYKYYAPYNLGANDTNRIKLQLTIYKDEFYKELIEHFSKPTIQVMAVPRNVSWSSIHSIMSPNVPDLPFLEPIREDVRANALGDHHFIINNQYLANNTNEDFYIVINNTQSTYHMNYSIAVNVHEPLVLALNNMYGSRVTVGENDVYAIHAGSPGYLVVEIHECMGRVELKASNSPKIDRLNTDDDDIDNKDPGIDDESFTGTATENDDAINMQMVVSPLGTHINFGIISIQSAKTVYVMATATYGERDSDRVSDLDAVYQIRATLYPDRSFYKFMSLQAGENGMLDWDATTPGKLKIGFEDVTEIRPFSDTGNYTVHYNYELILAKNSEIAGFVARCDMLPSAEGVFKGVDHYEKTIAFEDKDLTNDTANSTRKYVEVNTDTNFTEMFATMRITAVGVDSNGKQVFDYPVIYRTTEVQNMSKQGENDDSLLILLIILFVLLVVAIVGVYYYYEKWRRVKAKLNYQIEDLTHTQSTIEMFDFVEEESKSKKKSGYEGLIEDL